MKLRRAFSLIELLMVIVIISMLLAITLPSLHRARRQVERTMCLNNLKQIGMAANLYAQNHTQYIPFGVNSGSGDPAAVFEDCWFVKFLPYLGYEHQQEDYRDVKIYLCPSWPKNGTGYQDVSNSRQTVCYVVNDWGKTGHQNKPLRLTDIAGPSSIVYLADGENGSWRPIIEDKNSPFLDRMEVCEAGHLPDSQIENKLHGRRVARQRHDEGCNVLFLDWHSEWIFAEEMGQEMWVEN